MIIFDDSDDDEEERIGNILLVNHLTVMKMIMRYVVTIIYIYLIFVNFGSPPHYLTFKKVDKKCLGFQQ